MVKKIKNFIVAHHLATKIKESPKFNELFKNSFWSILGAIFSKGLLFLSWVLVARILGSDGYGQFGIVRSTVIMFTSFAGFSLGITASKHVAEFIEDKKERAGRVLGLTTMFSILMGIVVGVVFYFLSPWLAATTLGAPEITHELKISSLILFFSSLNGAQMGGLQGFVAFKEIAKINALQAVLSFPLFVLGALYLGVNGSIWAYMLSFVIICILSHYALKKESKKNDVTISFTNAWQEKDLLYTYSLPAFLGGLMVSPIKWMSEALLVSSVGFSEMGIFAAAYTFNNIIMVGAGMLKAPFVTVMAKNKEDSKDSKFSKFNILAPWAMGVFVSAPFLVFPELGSLIFGEEYKGDSFEWTFIIVILFTIVIMFRQGLARLLAVYDLQWWGFLDNLIWGGILLGSFYCMMKSSFNLSIAYLIAYGVNSVIFLPLYYKKNLLPDKIFNAYETYLIWMLIGVMVLIGGNVDFVFLKIIFLSLSILGLLKLFVNLLYK